MDPVPDTNVLIIGNGPAGLSLSAFLSGVLPYYNPLSPHPDAVIHKELSENSFQSLIDQDLSWCEYRDMMGGTSRPLSVLYDSLVRPGADVGIKGKSSLRWEFDRRRIIPHFVLGETPVGGSWNNYDPEMLAVSQASWLSLPGYSMSDYLGPESSENADGRMPTTVITNYMQAYVNALRLNRRMCTGTKVVSITKEDGLWRVSGIRGDDSTFTVTSKMLVLACGKTACRTLGVPGEEKCGRIVYDVSSLKTRLALRDAMEIGEPADMAKKRVVVVGDGISSADAVRQCLQRGIPVLHVMRRNDRQLRSILMSRLTKSQYPEYYRIHQLMTGRQTDALYEKLTSANISSVDDDTVTIETTSGERVEPFAEMAVCIGRVSETDDILQGSYTFNGYQAEEDPTLYCVGSLAGDHFVRYLVGGCLEVARSIHRTSPELVNNNNNNVIGGTCPCLKKKVKKKCWLSGVEIF